MKNSFDIVIIGGGHAGVEAAYIASQFKLNIAIISLPDVGLASAPCNPSIGGVGKGQVVRELDALGGLMPILADMAGIQFRTLNESKGYAVQSTRVQIDKEKYSIYAEDILSQIPYITIIKEKVENISNEDGRFTIKTTKSQYFGNEIIMTVGTFLNGKLHIGSETSTGGRYATETSESLSSMFKNIKTTSARFKTGTPARLDKNSINYSVLEEQPSDSTVQNFHSFNHFNSRNLKQVSCYLARTNEKTMSIIRDNRERSPMYNGQIQGVGARYCPSIEDKANRYPDKHNHHIFIEPEGLNLETVYPSGISSSLPREVQDDFMQSIQGLENCKILVYGYAVEYDVVDTTLLTYGLEHKQIHNLYFAGQVNGTSGYEEAAAQGFIAGANAALKFLKKDPLVLSRNDSYIGVMIEDLISNTRDEPYRLFTARNENRLYVREDNSVLRMSKYRKHLGLNDPRDIYNDSFESNFNIISVLLANTYLNADDRFFSTKKMEITRRMSLSEILKIATIDPIEVLQDYLNYVGVNVPRETVRCLAISTKYDGYIQKASDQYKKVEKLDSMKINWERIIDSNNVSFECKQRIKKIKPETFGQLKIIEGIRPATLAVVASKSI